MYFEDLLQAIDFRLINCLSESQLMENFHESEIWNVTQLFKFYRW